jgi:GNAT superfamily N-acetyltransferase
MGIRQAVPGDWQGISRLLTQLDYPGTEGFIQARLKTLLADPAAIVLVWAEPAPTSPETRVTATSAPEPLSLVDAGGSVLLACLSLHFIPQLALEGDFARISYFAVDDSARGRSIGRQMEEAATRLARDRGCALLEVHCHSRRTRAHEFYARQGYTESPKYLIKKL